MITEHDKLELGEPTKKRVRTAYNASSFSDITEESSIYLDAEESNINLATFTLYSRLINEPDYTRSILEGISMAMCDFEMQLQHNSLLSLQANISLTLPSLLGLNFILQRNDDNLIATYTYLINTLEIGFLSDLHHKIFMQSLLNITTIDNNACSSVSSRTFSKGHLKILNNDILLTSPQLNEGYKYYAAFSDSQEERLNGFNPNLEELSDFNSSLELDNFINKCCNDWDYLWIAIDEGKTNVLDIYETIPAENKLKQALETCHAKQFIYSFITLCTLSKRTNLIIPVEDGDLNIYKDAFKHSIDAVIRIINDKNLSLHFDLPSHHAEVQKQMGFCFLSFSQIAFILQKEFMQETNDEVITHACILDIDIHPSNGVNSILQHLDANNKLSHSILHLDCHGNQNPSYATVYPHKRDDLDYEIKLQKYHYLPLIMHAQSNGSDIMLNIAIKIIHNYHQWLHNDSLSTGTYYLQLLLGWDSHVSETPFQFSGSILSTTAGFTDEDYKLIYRVIVLLEQHANKYNKKFMTRVIVEGGYNQDKLSSYANDLREYITDFTLTRAEELITIHLNQEFFSHDSIMYLLKDNIKKLYQIRLTNKEESNHSSNIGGMGFLTHRRGVQAIEPSSSNNNILSIT